MDLETRLNEVVAALNTLEQQRRQTDSYALTPDPVTWKDRRRFIAIDFGGSGAFLVEKATGELFNIKSKYGIPDYNKKEKANLGNIYTVDPAVLHGKRWNYLR